MMRRITFIALILSSTFILQAQNDADYLKHELKASVGPSFVSISWLQSDICFANFSVSYFYRPVKWFWVGGNFINFFGERVNYSWREYDTNGNFKDFSKSKIKYCAVIAPEVRFSYLDRKAIIIYGALSAGVGFEDGYDSRFKKYPRILPYFQITYLGISGNFGSNYNIFLGGELGIGMKGLASIHGGYRF